MNKTKEIKTMTLNNDLFVKHLQGMVQFPTVSSVDPDKINKQAFLDFHKYLEETYPLVHKTFEKTIVGRVGLLYHWKGTGKSKSLPLLLTAHQDVVPEGDHSMWKYPPYVGTLDEDGILWGRGVTDSKCNIQAYMDALELLIADGFVPDYDLYLAFGYNEEIMGGPEAAAGLIVEELKRRNVDLGLVIDECGGISEKNGKLVAEIFPCEKGYGDFEFTMEDKGGHAASPGHHSSLGIIGKTACILEENLFPQTLTAPVIQQFKALAPFTEGPLGEMYADPEKHWDMLKLICAENRQLNALTRTTTAVTMAKGSDQANILPEKASLIINTRLLPGETLDNMMKYFESIVPEGVKVRLVKGHNPPAISSTESEGYLTIKKVIEEKYPGITFIPAMLTGGTDSRFYCDVCSTKSVYRFTGMRHSGKTGGAHQVNEHIDTSIISDNVDFYIKLIMAYGK